MTTLKLRKQKNRALLGFFVNGVNRFKIAIYAYETNKKVIRNNETVNSYFFDFICFKLSAI